MDVADSSTVTCIRRSSNSSLSAGLSLSQPLSTGAVAFADIPSGFSASSGSTTHRSTVTYIDTIADANKNVERGLGVGVSSRMNSSVSAGAV